MSLIGWKLLSVNKLAKRFWFGLVGWLGVWRLEREGLLRETKWVLGREEEEEQMGGCGRRSGLEEEDETTKKHIVGERPAATASFFLSAQYI